MMAVSIGKVGVERMHLLAIEQQPDSSLLESHRATCRREWEGELQRKEENINELKRDMDNHRKEAEQWRARLVEERECVQNLRDELAEKERTMRDHVEIVAKVASEKAAAAASTQAVKITKDLLQSQMNVDHLQDNLKAAKHELEELREEVAASRLKDAHSQRKGVANENEWEDYLQKCPLFATYARMSAANHSGDHIVTTHTGLRVIIDNKNNSPGPGGTVATREITKLKNDMNSNHIAVGILVARNAVAGGPNSERFNLDDGTPAVVHVCPNVDLEDEVSRAIPLAYVHLANIQAAVSEREGGNGAADLDALPILQENLRLLKAFRKRQEETVQRLRGDLTKQQQVVKEVLEAEAKLTTSARRLGVYVGDSLPSEEAERELSQEFIYTGSVADVVYLKDFLKRHRLGQKDAENRFGGDYFHSIKGKKGNRQLMLAVADMRERGKIPKEGEVVSLLFGFRARKRGVRDI